MLEDSVPICFVELASDFVSVGFLDDHLREETNYAFQELAPGRLFLTSALEREFVDGSDKVVLGTSYSFNPDGKMEIVKEEFGTGMISRAERTVDVSGNWDTYPSFGSYDSICRLER